MANLCKHCFHDFHMVVAKRKSPLFTILLLAVGTAIVTALTYGYVNSAQHTTRISLDQETESIVFTTKYADRTEAERVYWKDVSNIEYIANARPRPFEIAVVTTKGERFVYQQANEPLDVQADKLGKAIGRPVVSKDNYEKPSVLQDK